VESFFLNFSRQADFESGEAVWHRASAVLKRKPAIFPCYQKLQTLMRITLIAMAVATHPLHGQPQDGGRGGGEVFALSGVAAGGLGTRAVLGGGAGTNISRYIMALAEASVIPLNNQTLLPLLPNGAVSARGSDLFDFNVALQVQVPIRRWAPYGTMGAAVLMNPYTAGIPGPSGTIAYVGERHSKFGLEYGVGCRYYVRDNWGVRAEYRYTSSTRNFNRVLGGVFYRFEGVGLFTMLPALGRQLRR
jgi:opacity protein-like surface antigen